MTASNLDNIDNVRVLRAIKNLPPDQQQAILQSGQLVVLSEPYYSKVRISSDAVAGGVITFSKQTRTCFDYAKGDQMINAGFPNASPYLQAVDADTNLLSKGETNAAQFVFWDGLSIHVMPRTDPEVLRQLWPDLYFSASLEGRVGQFRLGHPQFHGGGGGLFGGGMSDVLVPNLQDARAIVPGYIANGLPSVQDTHMFPDPILWGPKGKADSTFAVQVELQRAHTATSATRAADAANNIAATTAVPNQSAVTDVAGTFLEFLVQLHCIQLAPRGNNR